MPGRGWLAGFLPPSELAAVVGTLAAHSFNWTQNTLLVLDYAAQIAVPLRRWLDRLAARTLATKLRILLLEREAPEGFGWWRELTSPRLQSAAARRDLFYDNRPRVVPDFADREERRALIHSALHAATALAPDAFRHHAVPKAGANHDFDRRLDEPRFGNPPSLAMAGVIACERGAVAALALRRLDTARHFGRRELKRLVDLAVSNQIDGETMRYMVAFNALSGGLPLGGLQGDRRKFGGLRAGAAFSRLLSDQGWTRGLDCEAGANRG